MKQCLGFVNLLCTLFLLVLISSNLLTVMYYRDEVFEQNLLLIKQKIELENQTQELIKMVNELNDQNRYLSEEYCSQLTPPKPKRL